MIFFHRYYIYNLFNNQTIIDINSKEFPYLCISCFILGAKSSEALMNIDIILKYINEKNIIKIDINNSLESYKKLIFYYEFEILSSINFDIKSYDISYKNISLLFDKIKLNINDNSKLKTIKEYLVAQVRYSFIFPLFLKFNPLTIVLSCINILLKQLSFNYEIEQIISDINGTSETSRSDVEKCSILFDIYLFPKNNKSENNNINMDIIRKINSINSNKIHSLKTENINDNINKMEK